MAQEGFQLMKVQERRGAAADVNGIKEGKYLPVEGHFLHYGFQKSVCAGAIRFRVETAIGAFAPAKGDMDIKTW